MSADPLDAQLARVARHTRDIETPRPGGQFKVLTKKSYTMRLTETTVERVGRFAKARGLDRTGALEMMIEEYSQCLDGYLLVPKWETNARPRGGLKTWAANYGRPPADGRKKTFRYTGD